jgi:hypothetical protein
MDVVDGVREPRRWNIYAVMFAVMLISILFSLEHCLMYVNFVMLCY